MHWARKKQFCKSHSRILSIILIRDGRFSGVKPFYLLNFSHWLYVSYLFWKLYFQGRLWQWKKMIPGVYLKLPGISFSPRTQTGPWSATASYAAVHLALTTLRALGLLLADGALTVGRGKTFWHVNCFIFTKTAVTREQKVEKSLPTWDMNRVSEG